MSPCALSMRSFRLMAEERRRRSAGCVNLYKALGVDPSAHIEMAVRYNGLLGRKLGSSSPARYHGIVGGENTLEVEVTSAVVFGLSTVESLAEAVKKLCEPLFVVFDYSTVPDEVYKQIVTDFMNGKVS